MAHRTAQVVVLGVLLGAVLVLGVVLLWVWSRPLPGQPYTTDPCSIIALSATEASSVSLAAVYGCEPP